MKSLMQILSIVAVLSFTFSLNGQIKFGFKGGVSSFDLKPGDLIISSNEDLKQFGLKVDQADLGIHFGIMTQFNFANLFIQPEVLLNSNSVNYRVTDFSSPQVGEELLKEKYQHVDIPIIIGARLGPLRIGGGPTGHVFINSTSELFKFSEYSQVFKNITYGWQAGLGLDLWSVHLDIRYEGNFAKFGEHIVWNGQSYNFDKSPARILASVGITL